MAAGDLISAFQIRFEYVIPVDNIVYKQRRMQDWSWVDRQDFDLEMARLVCKTLKIEEGLVGLCARPSDDPDESRPVSVRVHSWDIYRKYRG